jgi:cell division transport system permease protein
LSPRNGNDRSTLTSLGYFMREALRRIWLSKRASLAAIGMISISLVTVGAFALLSENLARAVDRWEGALKLTVYLQPQATPAAIARVEEYLSTREDFSSRRFVTREEAMERFRTYFGTLAPVLDEIGENPFPASFEIDIPAEAVRSHKLDNEIAALRRVPVVDDVQFDWDWIARLRRFVNLVNILGLVAGGVLAAAAIFTIANVIRLKMILYREEIDIMRLVGASEGTVRGPFLVEGVVQGLAGALLAIAGLGLLFASGRRLVGGSQVFVLEFLFSSFLPLATLGALLVAGAAAGAFGSWISLREYDDAQERA